MCCGSAFWKGFLAFVLTFASGVFLSGFSSLRTATTEFCPTVKSGPSTKNQKSENAPLTEQKKCVPVDGNLKYERLRANEKPDSEVIKNDEKKNSLKVERKAQKNPAEPNRRFFNSPKSKAEIKDLLHREKCFEIREQE